MAHNSLGPVAQKEDLNAGVTVFCVKYWNGTLESGSGERRAAGGGLRAAGGGLRAVAAYKLKRQVIFAI